MTTTAPASPTQTASDEEPVLLQTLAGGVLRLTLNRPDKLNAIDRSLGMLLLDAFDRAIDDPSIRVVVLTGAGSAFCAGDDIGAIDACYDGELADGPFFHGTRDTIYLRIIHAMMSCPKPVVVALNGVAAGAGTELACAADIRIAAANARIGSRLVRIGQVGNGVTLPRVVGPARAFEIFATGRFVGSEEALRIGLVNEVVPDESLQTRVDEVAGGLASAATKAIALYKQLLLRSWAEPLPVGLRLQDDLHRACQTEVQDAQEGIRSFVEKRPPNFSGL